MSIRKTIFFSDTHGFAEAWLGLFRELGYIDSENNWIGPDDVRLIHVGDHVDRGEDSVGLYMWLRDLQKQLGQDRVIRLLGNHDIQYIGGPEFDLERSVEKIAPIMRQDVLDGTLKFAHQFVTESGDEWLCVHAGLDSGWEEHDMSMSDVVDSLNSKGIEVISDAASHRIITGVGRSRGGSSNIPGICWADYYEDMAPMEPLLTHKQIIGHSIQRNGIRLSPGGMIWAVNVMYDHAQVLIYDHGTDSFSRSSLRSPDPTKSHWAQLLG